MESIVTEFIKSGLLSLKNVLLVSLLIFLISMAKQINNILKKVLCRISDKLCCLFDKDKKRKKRRLVKNVDLGEKIDELLMEMLAVFGADRIYVVTYHNSIVLANGLHWYYASVMSEVMRRGMQPFFTNFKSLPVSLFAHYNKRIIAKELVYNEDVQALADKDCATYETMLSSSTKSNYAYGLFDLFGCNGFVCMDYCVEKHKLTEYDISKFIEYANKISVCLELKK